MRRRESRENVLGKSFQIHIKPRVWGKLRKGFSCSIRKPNWAVCKMWHVPTVGAVRLFNGFSWIFHLICRPHIRSERWIRSELSVVGNAFMSCLIYSRTMEQIERRWKALPMIVLPSRSISITTLCLTLSTAVFISTIFICLREIFLWAERLIMFRTILGRSLNCFS